MDFDNDGVRNELVLRNGPQVYHFGTDGHPQLIAEDLQLTYLTAGDITGDGFVDLVARDQENQLWLLPNDHGIGLSSRKALGLSLGVGAQVATADLDGDGRADLVETALGNPDSL